MTPSGEAKLAKIVAAFGGLGVELDVIVTSPYLRAHKTAEIVAEALSVPVVVDDRLCAGATPADYVAALAHHAADVERGAMVVGHEPDLGEFISKLVTGDETCGFRMKKAGLAKLTVDGLRDGRCGCLEWLLWPKQMVAVAS